MTAAIQMPARISFVRSFVNLLSRGCMMALYLDTKENNAFVNRKYLLSLLSFKSNTNTVNSLFLIQGYRKRWTGFEIAIT